MALRFETMIDIGAPPARVWEVLSDVERWPEWTASVTSVQRLDDGTFGTGRRVRIKQPGFPAVIWTVTAVEPGRSFSWENRSPGIRSVGDHVLEPRADGGARVRLVLEQEGPIGAVVGRLTARRTRRYVQLEAEGLRRRAEGELPDQSDPG